MPPTQQRDNGLAQSHEERIRELWEAMDEIRRTKQNKFTAVAWVPLLVYMISVTIGGVWGAATLSADMENLTRTVQAGTADRYHASTAAADFALRDKDIAYNAAGIVEFKDSIARIDRNVDRITAHLTEGHD